MHTHPHRDSNLVTHINILILNTPWAQFSNCRRIESHADYEFVIGFNSIADSHYIKRHKHRGVTGTSIIGNIIVIEVAACVTDCDFAFI